MPEPPKTNICCLDLSKDCIAYLQSLGFNVYNGSLGSVFSIKWNGRGYGNVSILHDTDYPLNLLEYHVFIHDMGNATHKEYHSSDHVIKDVESPHERHLVCHFPVTSYDLRPFGSSRLHSKLADLSNHQRIEIIFTEAENTVEYKSNCVGYEDPETIGTISNFESWGIRPGETRYGERVECEENWVSKALFEGRLNQVKYYGTYHLPYEKQGEDKVINNAYMPLLKNEAGEYVAYCYAESRDLVQFVLPQVEDKADLLKRLFEEVLFRVFSDFFPDIEAHQWIHNSTYLLPEENQMQKTIEDKHEEYRKEIESLEKQAEEISGKYAYLRQLLSSSGVELVSAVKTYLEWLGFENVIDKDETVEVGGIREEDLCFEYEGNLVLVEVKGINGTSTDAECAQIDKIVFRRMRALNSTAVHGVYIVNNQKNVEPLKRQVPPFNDTQITDAENQSRTMIYTPLLFALHSDIENGIISKEEARRVFLQSGIADFQQDLISLGIPYDYYQKGTVVCLDLDGYSVSVGDTLFYKDNLQRLIGVTVESIEQEKRSQSSVSQGKTGLRVNQEVPRNRMVYIKR